LTLLAAAASASPVANRPASRIVTTRLRTGSIDHNAEAVPQTRRHPSRAAERTSAGRGLTPLVDSIKPVANRLAIETSGTIALGTRTRSGKNGTAVASRPAPHQDAIRRAERSEVS
jgi:hypothetical protein